MYPFLRLANEFRRFRNAPALGLGDAHVSHHRCWPWDLDPWSELNNGRTLTLYDLGRLPYSRRVGLFAALRAKGLRATVAGVSVRYRRRITALSVLEMHTRTLGWDHRFFYLDQSLWRGDGECANQMLLRSAVISRDGIVAPREITAALGGPEESPPLPDWVRDWIAAEDARPWPPTR